MRFSRFDPVEQKAVLGRALDGIAERADAARNDRDLLHRIDAGQRRRHQRMAHLVVRDAAPFFGIEHAAFLLQPGDDALDRLGEIVEIDRRRVAPRRHDGRLIDQIGDVGAGEAGGHAGDDVEIDIRRELHLAHVDLEDLQPALAVGTVDQHLAVEAPGAQQRRIENFRPVGRGEQDDAAARIEAVEFGKELIERLLLLVGAAEAARRCGFGPARPARR